MSKLTAFIAKYQITGFYLLVFGISWPSMGLIFFILPQDSALQPLFGLAATFSPALIALMISAVANPGPKDPRRVSRWIVFVAAWLFSWVVLLLHTWQIRGMALEPQVVIPSAMVALLPGWLVSCGLSRVPGVRALFSTLLRPRGCWLLYLVALLTVPAAQLAGVGITALFGGEVGHLLGGMTFTRGVVVISLMFLQGFLVSGGINEETGWRGFILPRLQARYPVLAAIAIVWFFWALWHIPYDIGLGTPIEGIMVNRILHNFVWAVLFAWVYNRTGGSLLAPAIFHPAMNAFGDTLPRTDVSTVILVVLILVVIFRERMWKKMPADSPSVLS